MSGVTAGGGLHEPRQCEPGGGGLRGISLLLFFYIFFKYLYFAGVLLMV